MNTSPNYYTHVRKDVLAHVPHEARRVLSVGCGEGRTEAELVACGVDVTGIELNPEAAKAAALAGIKVICGDANSSSEQLAGCPPFDCLIYADVLEHILDPESVLREHVKFLAPGGVVIVSVPNFRHNYIFRQLFLAGHIRYRDAGVLDRTHVRITTRRMVEEWFETVGLATLKIDFVNIRRRDRFLSWITFGLFREFLFSQVIVVGFRP